MLMMSPTPKYLEEVLSDSDGNKSDKKDFPYKITKVDDAINKDLLQYFTGMFQGWK